MNDKRIAKLHVALSNIRINLGIVNELIEEIKEIEEIEECSKKEQEDYFNEFIEKINGKLSLIGESNE